MANEKKYITIDNLRHYHEKLMLYIEEKATSMDDILEIIGDFSGNSYYVRYYDNYSINQKIISVDKNITITIAISPFTREGYNFKYWTTTPQDSGAYYEPGELVTITLNLSLFAQWELISNEEPALSPKRSIRNTTPAKNVNTVDSNNENVSENVSENVNNENVSWDEINGVGSFDEIYDNDEIVIEPTDKEHTIWDEINGVGSFDENNVNEEVVIEPEDKEHTIWDEINGVGSFDDNNDNEDIADCDPFSRNPDPQMQGVGSFDDTDIHEIINDDDNENEITSWPETKETAETWPEDIGGIGKFDDSNEKEELCKLDPCEDNPARDLRGVGIFDEDSNGVGVNNNDENDD